MLYIVDYIQIGFKVKKKYFHVYVTVENQSGSGVISLSRIAGVALFKRWNKGYIYGIKILDTTEGIIIKELLKYNIELKPSVLYSKDGINGVYLYHQIKKRIFSYLLIERKMFKKNEIEDYRLYNNC